MRKHRVQFSLSDETECDVIHFIQGLKKSEKHIILVHALRTYMNYIGYRKPSVRPVGKTADIKETKIPETKPENIGKESESGLLSIFPDDDN